MRYEAIHPHPNPPPSKGREFSEFPDGRSFWIVDDFLHSTIEGLTKRLPKYYEMVRIGLRLPDNLVGGILKRDGFLTELG